jgi:hypothetical protein
LSVTSTINLVAGGSADEVVVEDTASPPDNLAVADITWAPGSPADPNVTVAPAADGTGFNFTAGAAAAAGSYPFVATYKGPGTPSNPSSPDVTVMGTLMVVVQAAAAVVTALQFNELTGD